MRFAMVTLTAMLACGGALLVAPSAAVAAPTAAERQRWYFDLLKIPAAHQISTGEGVTVVVMDSGVDASHPDLQGKVRPGKGINGEAADGRSDRNSEAQHGTEMAGIIAGTGGGDRATGIAPGATIVPYAFGSRGNDDASAAAGIRWAADNGAKVLNLSWGADSDAGPDTIAAVDYALGKDVVIVAAAGNLEDGDRNVTWPAKINGVIGVTGVGQNGAFWPGSVEGPGAVLSAPAQDIIAAKPKSPSGYAITQGTSSAAAIVSGAAALVRAKFPDLDAANVIERLIETADDRGPQGWDGQYGDGVVNPVAALTADVPAVDRNPLLPRPGATGDGSTAAQPEGEGDSDGLISVEGDPTPWYILGGVCLLMTVGVIALIVFVVTMGRRKGPPSMSAGAPPPNPLHGYPPPGQSGLLYPPMNQPGPQYPPPGGPQPGPPYSR